MTKGNALIVAVVSISPSGTKRNVSDKVMTVSTVMTVLNKFRLCVVLMFQTVITMPTYRLRYLHIRNSDLKWSRDTGANVAEDSPSINVRS